MHLCFLITLTLKAGVHLYRWHYVPYWLTTDDVNWNPMDWDRAAEELTWERV